MFVFGINDKVQEKKRWQYLDRFSNGGGCFEVDLDGVWFYFINGAG